METPTPHESGVDGPAETGQQSREVRPPKATPLSQTVGRIVMGLVVVLFVVFAIINRQPVDFSWVFGETHVVQEGGEYVRGGVPLILLLIGSFVLGGIVSAGMLWRRRRGRRVRERSQKQA